MNILDIPLLSGGRDQLSQNEVNSILLFLRSITQTKRSFMTGMTQGDVPSAFTDDGFLEIKTTKALAAYSIFNIQYVDKGFRADYPAADAYEDCEIYKLSKSKGQIYVTNGGTPLKAGTVARMHIVGCSRPHRIRYSGTAPSLGDKVKPTKSGNAVERHNNGQFIAVTNPDTNQGTTWIVRKDSPYGMIPYVQTCTNDDHPDYPAYYGANRFVVRRGVYVFDDTNVGFTTPSFVPYDPPEYYIAFNECGYVPEGTIARMTLDNGQWYLLKYCCCTSSSFSSSSKSSSSLSSSSSSSLSSSSSSSSSDSSSISSSESSSDSSLSSDIPSLSSPSISSSKSSSSSSDSSSNSSSDSSSDSSSNSGSSSDSSSGSGSYSSISGSPSPCSFSSPIYPPGTCYGTCAFQWNGSTWTQISFCSEVEPAECYSCMPGTDGTVVGEIYSQPCEGMPI